MEHVWGVVVAAGSGTRFGGAKQFALLAGRPVVWWSVAACREALGHVVVVLPKGTTGDTFGADIAVEGGATRAGSVRNGLAVVPPDARVVVVHDAARPLARPALFREVVAALDAPGISATVPGIPVADTLKRVVAASTGASALDRTPGSHGAVEESVVVETVDRSGLVAVQTPQAFDAGVLRRAHLADGDATDDAALVEGIGALVRVVPGDPRNRKLTGPEDLALFELLLEV